MKQVKISCYLICICLFSTIISGCKSPTSNDTSNVNELQLMTLPDEESTDSNESSSIRMTSEEIRNDLAIALNGFFALDENIISSYDTDSEYTNSLLNYILTDERALSLWKDTIGTFHYYPDIDMIVGKDVNTVFAMWYNDCRVNDPAQVENITDTRDLTYNQVMQIYNDYYASAPYVCISPYWEMCTMPKPSSDAYTINDPYEMFLYIEETDSGIKIDYSSIIGLFDSSYEITALTYNNKLNQDNFPYSFMVTGFHDSMLAGPDMITHKFPDYDKLVNLDLNSLIKITGNENSYKADSTLIATYKDYILNDTYHDKIQKYLDDNCIIYPSFNNIILLRKIVPSTEIWPYKADESTINALSDLTLYSQYTWDEMTTISDYSLKFYNDIIQDMLQNNLIE